MAISGIQKVDALYMSASNGVIHPDGFGIFLCTAGFCRLGFDNMSYAMVRNMLFIFKYCCPIKLEKHNKVLLER